MGTGYTRNDTSNNIANGKVIDATDLDGEFDAIVTAFSTSGHTHDGTSAEGGAVTKLLGTSLTLGDGTAGTDITVTFDGETSDGILKWMEDEDYFQFNDDILINTNEKLYFRDTGIYISSNADGDLDIVSDGTAVDSINIESAGGITLDAGTAASGVIFEDDGTEMLRIYNSSSDVHIESKVSNKDILIRGNDNGSDITAVTFDMSEAGLATFGGGITSTAVANTLGATSFSDANITNVGNIALDSITADGSTITITGNTTFADGSFNFNIASHDGSNGLQLGGVLVTATAAELNIMDGVTATTSELNILDGVTATATELNIIDGVTATTAELNIMDGVTANTSELNIMDGVTATTSELNIMDGVTSTTAELNILDGVTSTTSEINLLDGSAKSTSSITIADADAFIVIDGNTTKQIPASDLTTYIGGSSTAGQLSTGTGNTAIGSSALDSITSGALHNTAIGFNAGTAITDTDYNTLIGYDAGAAVTGQGNVAVGTNALKSQSTNASLNVAVGYLAMEDNVGSSNNVAIGYSALGNLTVSSNTEGDNVAIGSYSMSLASNHNTHNVAVGYTSGFYTGYASASIGNVAIGSNSMRGTSASEGDYNTAIGYYTLRAVTTGEKNTVVGGNALTAITTGDNNVAVGFDANAGGTSGNNNLAVGFEALKAGGGGNGSFAIGYRAMYQYTGGYTHVAVGNNALQSMTSGSQQDNCCVGDGSGANGNDASGSGNRQNAFFGNSSGSRNTTGKINTCIGYSAGGFTGTGMTGQENTFVGGYSSGNVTSGNYNTSIGRSAGQDLQSGDKNTSVGWHAGLSITTGSNNLFLGVEAGKSGSPGGAQTTGSNEIFLGDENITAAHIQVDWTVASDQRDKTDFSSLDVGLDFVNQLKPYTFKWDKRIKYVNREGKNGVITKSVENGTSVEDKWEDTVDLDTITSDGTHKEDWLDIGFKAQDVEILEKAAGYKIADKTNLTTTLTNDGKQYGIKYNKFVPILVKAIQELSAKNDALEARIKTLEG
tara:strand:+ start:574 stop:3609 length:3036 start_codon:yes stop_codon:yes gene_type:complete